MDKVLRRDVRVWVSSLEPDPDLIAGNEDQIAARTCGATGKVTCTFPEHDTFFVRHENGTVAPYKGVELTIIEEAAAPRSEFDPSTSDGPFSQPAPAA